MLIFNICVCPPLIVKHRKGNFGFWWFSSLIKWAKMWACIWFTAIRGMFKAIAIDFAKEVPTNNDPINPGPLVKAMALKSFLFIPDWCIACCTTGTIFCWCALEASSGTTPP